MKHSFENHFPSRQTKRQTSTIPYLFSPLTFPPNQETHFHRVLVFMKTRVSKSLQWIYIWYKLRCASYSLASCPLIRFPWGFVPPTISTVIDLLFKGFLCRARPVRHICKGALVMLGLFSSAVLFCGVVKWGICLFCGLGEWRAPL